MQEIFELAKIALRVTTSAFDAEIQGLVYAALADLGLAGVSKCPEDDPLIVRAILTYCKANFGSSDDYDRLRAAYDEQKAMLRMASGYTDWGDDDG